MTREEILSMVDHTLLAPEATWEQIMEVCRDGIQYHTASVCIPPSFVKRAAEYVEGRIPVCTVIGFPNGYEKTQGKVWEARAALEDGAAEFDMVINIGALKEGRYQDVKEEIQEIKKAVGGHILKVIIETCLLTREEKIRMCSLVSEAGADYIKTSTGFSKGGATPEDVALLKQYVSPRVKVKAAGGIRSFQDGENFIARGASRLGTSRLVTLQKEENNG